MEKKLQYLKEYLTYKNMLDDINLDKLAVVQDEVYTMELYDISYINYSETEVILKVNFYETNNPKHKGMGSFKHSHSDIPGVSDTTPIKLNGVLEDIFEENAEIIVEFIEKIYDKIKF
tara:strand:- start:106846 stop:107199 length:354 start_codon:yes stop_codon:yes gene_type:complete